MTEPYKTDKQAIKNAAQGQELTDAWHKRMRELDSKIPKFVRTPDDDPKRGATSPLGGKVW